MDDVKARLDAGEDVNRPYDTDASRTRSSLQQAVEDGSLEMLDLLLKAGADVNAPAARRRGATAIQLAAITGSLGIAETLIHLGAVVNVSRAEEDGRTALEGAAEHGRIDMVQYLLSEGAETRGRGQFQYMRAIKLAEKEGHLVVANLLREYRTWTTADHHMWDVLNSHQEDWEGPWAVFLFDDWGWETEIGHNENMSGAWGDDPIA